jgi:hypothetical protein
LAVAGLAARNGAGAHPVQGNPLFEHGRAQGTALVSSRQQFHFGGKP